MVAQVDPRVPPGQPCHLAEAADPAEARDLPKIPCHGHPDLLAWIPSHRISAPWRASLPGRSEPWVSLWERNPPLCSRLWTKPWRNRHTVVARGQRTGASPPPDNRSNWDDRGMTRSDGYLLD